jgi:hypothetical protein
VLVELKIEAFTHENLGQLNTYVSWYRKHMKAEADNLPVGILLCALETNDSAVKVLGDETLRAIARELVETVRKNVTIDWHVKESVRARMRVMVKRVLRKHGYPLDKQEKATQTVIEQDELLSLEWAA